MDAGRIDRIDVADLAQRGPDRPDLELTGPVTVFRVPLASRALDALKVLLEHGAREHRGHRERAAVIVDRRDLAGQPRQEPDLVARGGVHQLAVVLIALTKPRPRLEG